MSSRHVAGRGVYTAIDYRSLLVKYMARVIDSAEGAPFIENHHGVEAVKFTADEREFLHRIEAEARKQIKPGE